MKTEMGVMVGSFEWTQALVFLISQVWVGVPVVTLVSLCKTLDHYCFVLRMGQKAILCVV